MKIRFWGTRGSIPAPGPATVRYGGNTSCVEVRLKDGTLIILDAGTGIRELGRAYGPCEATVLLSHYHWDHIQGYPFFGPGFSPESRIRVLGPESAGRQPRELLTAQMDWPFFPAPAADMQGITSIEATPCEPFALGNATVRAALLSHPGTTFGYRIEEDGHSFVYISDDEVAVAPLELLAGIVELAAGADLVLHDCQYSEEEYASRVGWGHSTPRQAARIAEEAGACCLTLFHHDPCHNDEQVEGLAAQVRKLSRQFDVEIAREGETVLLGELAAVDYPPAVGGQ